MKKYFGLAFPILFLSTAAKALPSTVAHLRSSFNQARLATPNDLDLGRNLDCREISVKTGTASSITIRFTGFDGLIRLTPNGANIKEKLFASKVSSKGRQELMSERFSEVQQCNSGPCAYYDTTFVIRVTKNDDIIVETSFSRGIGEYQVPDYDEYPDSVAERRMKATHYILCPNN